MPIYEYRCENGHLFEVMQKITDDPVTTCEDVRRAGPARVPPVAVHFKGSGFYNTDYGTAKRKREQDASAKADKGDGKKGGDGARRRASRPRGRARPAALVQRWLVGRRLVRRRLRRHGGLTARVTAPTCDPAADRLSRSQPWT